MSSITEMTLVLWAGSLLAGFLGALTGLGGGAVIVPLLTLGFGVDLRYAVGSSLVSVIATSSGASAAFVKGGFTNIRIGMFLEVATTIGALFGAYIAGLMPTTVIAIIFGVVLIFTALMTIRQKDTIVLAEKADPLAQRLKLNSSFPTDKGPQEYSVTGVSGGFVIMLAAGVLSAILGIGSGVLKVLAMDQLMRVPFKVSTTTSNFMIGVTAAASAGIYLSRGYIDPVLAMPVTLGVLIGSITGARVLPKVRVKLLRIIFAVAIVILGGQMIYKGVAGQL